MIATHICGTYWEGPTADVVSHVESHKMRCPAERAAHEREAAMAAHPSAWQPTLVPV